MKNEAKEKAIHINQRNNQRINHKIKNGWKKYSRHLHQVLSLLMVLCLCSACSLIQKPQEEEPVLEEVELPAQEEPTELLAFFENGASGKTRDEIREVFLQLIDFTLNHYGDTPLLISRLSNGIGGLPQDNEQGLVKFNYATWMDEGYEIAYPSSNMPSSISWNDKDITAIETTPDLEQLAFVNIPSQELSIEQFPSSEELLVQNQQVWIGQLFTDGIYPISRQGIPLSFFENPFTWPANPNYYTFSLKPRFDDSDNQTGWDLIISLREAQTYTQDLMNSKLVFEETIGEKIQKNQEQTEVLNNSFTWVRFDINQRDVTLSFDLEGVLQSSIVDLSIFFQTHTFDGQVMRDREKVTTAWYLDPYPDAQRWKESISQMMAGVYPGQFIDDMGYIHE